MMVVLLLGAFGLFILGQELAGKAVLRLARTGCSSSSFVTWLGKDDMLQHGLVIWVPVIGTILPQPASWALVCFLVVLVLHVVPKGASERARYLDTISGMFAGLGLMLLAMHFFAQTGAALGAWIGSVPGLPSRLGGSLVVGLLAAAVFRSFLPVSALALALVDGIGIGTVALVIAAGLPGEAFGKLIAGRLGKWKRGAWKQRLQRSSLPESVPPVFLEDTLESELYSLRCALADALGTVRESLLALMNSFSGEGWDGDGFLASAELVVHAESLNTSVGRSLARIIETPRQNLEATSLLAIQGISHETGRIVEANRALADKLTKRSVKGFRFHDAADEELVECIALILDFLRYCEDALGLRLREAVNLELGTEMYEGIRKTGTQLRKTARKAMEKGGAGIREELAFLDILSELEAVAWRSLVIAKTLPALDALHREVFKSSTPH